MGLYSLLAFQGTFSTLHGLFSNAIISLAIDESEVTALKVKVR